MSSQTIILAGREQKLRALGPMLQSWSQNMLEIPEPSPEELKIINEYVQLTFENAVHWEILNVVSVIKDVNYDAFKLYTIKLIPLKAKPTIIGGLGDYTKFLTSQRRGDNQNYATGIKLPSSRYLQVPAKERDVSYKELFNLQVKNCVNAFINVMIRDMYIGTFNIKCQLEHYLRQEKQVQNLTVEEYLTEYFVPGCNVMRVGFTDLDAFSRKLFEVYYKDREKTGGSNSWVWLSCPQVTNYIKLARPENTYFLYTGDDKTSGILMNMDDFVKQLRANGIWEIPNLENVDHDVGDNPNEVYVEVSNYYLFQPRNYKIGIDEPCETQSRNDIYIVGSSQQNPKQRLSYKEGMDIVFKVFDDFFEKKPDWVVGNKAGVYDHRGEYLHSAGFIKDNLENVKMGTVRNLEQYCDYLIRAFKLDIDYYPNWEGNSDYGTYAIPNPTLDQQATRREIWFRKTDSRKLIRQIEKFSTVFAKNITELNCRATMKNAGGQNVPLVLSGEITKKEYLFAYILHLIIGDIIDGDDLNKHTIFWRNDHPLRNWPGKQFDAESGRTELKYYIMKIFELVPSKKIKSLMKGLHELGIDLPFSMTAWNQTIFLSCNSSKVRAKGTVLTQRTPVTSVMQRYADQVIFFNLEKKLGHFIVERRNIQNFPYAFLKKCVTGGDNEYVQVVGNEVDRGDNDWETKKKFQKGSIHPVPGPLRECMTKTRPMKNRTGFDSLTRWGRVNHPDLVRHKDASSKKPYFAAYEEAGKVYKWKDDSWTKIRNRCNYHLSKKTNYIKMPQHWGGRQVSVADPNDCLSELGPIAKTDGCWWVNKFLFNKKI